MKHTWKNNKDAKKSEPHTQKKQIIIIIIIIGAQKAFFSDFNSNEQKVRIEKKNGDMIVGYVESKFPKYDNLYLGGHKTFFNQTVDIMGGKITFDLYYNTCLVSSECVCFFSYFHVLTFKTHVENIVFLFYQK